MKDGIYKLIFTTNVNRNGCLDGIVTIKNGKINGGDYVCFYKGSIDGSKAFVKSVLHNKKETNAFNGKESIELILNIEDHQNHYLFKGHIEGDSSKSIHGQLNFLSELA
ncbi:hypothetical protein ACLEDV_08145 [Lonsdalea quercina]|uniref:hypothetical protein n=1 Tax=Lonsdalea quercina TaxID=71657 RepID=UPI0039752D20